MPVLNVLPEANPTTKERPELVQFYKNFQRIGTSQSSGVLLQQPGGQYHMDVSEMAVTVPKTNVVGGGPFPSSSNT